MSIIIRREENSDYQEVYELIKAAFAEAEHADGNEQDLVEALRRSESFRPELSLVAVDGERIVGHILFTEAEIGGRMQLALAPLSVRPDRQRQGIGGALIREGHRIAESLGYEFSVVLGSNAYYPRFGYVQAGTYGIQFPGEVPEEFFMAAKLKEAALECPGVIHYAPEFGL